MEEVPECGGLREAERHRGGSLWLGFESEGYGYREGGCAQETEDGQCERGDTGYWIKGDTDIAGL